MSKDRRTVVYVTRDIERALGMPPGPEYFIVTNRTSYGEEIERQYPEFVMLAEGGDRGIAGTSDLLEHPATGELISKITENGAATPRILVFKNTARIEPVAKSHG